MQHFPYISMARLQDLGGWFCTFCGKENDGADDMGWFYLWPRGIGKSGGCACYKCLEGEPGKAHRRLYGEGER